MEKSTCKYNILITCQTPDSQTTTTCINCTLTEIEQTLTKNPNPQTTAKLTILKHILQQHPNNTTPKPQTWKPQTT